MAFPWMRFVIVIIAFFSVSWLMYRIMKPVTLQHSMPGPLTSDAPSAQEHAVPLLPPELAAPLEAVPVEVEHAASASAPPSAPGALDASGVAAPLPEVA